MRGECDDQHLVVDVGVGDQDVGQLVGVDPAVPHPVALELTVRLQRRLPLQIHGDLVICVHQSEIIIVALLKTSALCIIYQYLK